MCVHETSNDSLMRKNKQLDINSCQGVLAHQCSNDLVIFTSNSASTRARECLLIKARMTWLYSQATRHQLEQGSACSSRLEWLSYMNKQSTRHQLWQWSACTSRLEWLGYMQQTSSAASTRARECLLIKARMTWLYSQATRHQLEQGSACSSRLEWLSYMNINSA